MKTMRQRSIGDVIMLLVTGKITKGKKIRSFFCLQDRGNSRLFSNEGDWGAVNITLFSSEQTNRDMLKLSG